MTSKEEFKAFAHAMVDYIIDYHDNIKSRPVLPKVTPGYLRPLVPEEAPEDPEHWEDIMKDLGIFQLPYYLGYRVLQKSWDSAFSKLSGN